MECCFVGHAALFIDRGELDACTACASYITDVDVELKTGAK